VRLCLIDGSGFIFRSFYAMPALVTESGQAVGAVVGFCQMLFRLQKQRSFTHWAVVFDPSGPNFRQDLFPLYKSHRVQAPQALISQFPLVMEACKAFDIPILIKEGFEADDVIATCVARAKQEEIPQDIEIVSSDKDLMQLVSPRCTLFDPLKEKLFDEQAVEEKWGVRPCQIPCVQALAGDSSDLIPGVPGIGPKTATELIKRFESLEYLLNHTDQVARPRQKNLLLEYADQARLSYKLALLDKEVPLEFTWDDLSVKTFDSEKVTTFLDAHQLYRLKARLQAQGDLSAPACQELTTGEKEMSTVVLQELKAKESICLLPLQKEGQLMGFWASYVSTESWYLPFKNDDLLLWQDLFTDPKVAKVFWDIKSWLGPLAKIGLKEVNSVQDQMLMAYAAAGCRKIDNAKTALDKWSAESSQRLNLPPGCDPAGCEVAYMYLLHPVLMDRLEKAGLWSLYHQIDLPLAHVLHHMEERGICLDTEYLYRLSQDLSAQLQIQEKIIFKETGQTFNLASPKQLGEILFDKLKWPCGKKGKSGAYKTSSIQLNEFAEKGYSLATDILKWRSLYKLKTTYTDSLVQQAGEDGRLHTCFSAVSTSTGRLSSLHPNLQNIPLGQPSIRRAFHASVGKVFVFMDYSQIELRLLAHMADIEVLKKAFQQGEDIHERTALDLFGCNDKETRRHAKAINFGILYGMSAFGLAKHLKLSQNEAQKYIDHYFACYPGVLDYIEACKKNAKEHGYVQTLWGRRCGIPFIHSSSYLQRQGAERQAVNAPLQGTSADIIKKAMIDIFKILPDMPQTELLLQIHDELVFEMPPEDVARNAPILQAAMENAVDLSVPLNVSWSQSSFWEDTEDFFWAPEPDNQPDHQKFSISEEK